MAGTNDFQTFAAAGGANVISQATYLALAAKANGFQSGIAGSAQLNKVWRQSSIMSSMIGQFICDEANTNAVDDGTIATLEANFILALQAVTLIKVTGTLNLYVNPSSGSDANNGLSLTSAFRTIQAAANSAFANYNFGNNPLIINLAAGTYSAGVTIYNMPVGCTAINITGGASLSAAASYQVTVTNGSGVTVLAGNKVNISGIQFTCSGSSGTIGYGVVAYQSTISVINCSFGSCGQAQVISSNGASVNVVNCSFSGNSSYGLVASDAFLAAASTSLAWNSASYSVCNAYANFGYLYAIGTSCSGAVTGTRWLTGNNGIISTNGAGVNLFPGTVAGQNLSGGQYT